MIRRGGYWKNFSERFGMIEKIAEKRKGVKRIWLQAVSVGELNAIIPLVDELLCEGDKEVVITTTTSTGYQIAKKNFQGKAIGIYYFPIDFWLFSKWAWDKIKPDMVILMESELWFEHLHQANERGVPAILINARISNRSYRRYRTLPFLSRILLDKLSAICVSSVLDYKKLLQLGLSQMKSYVTGNLKFDVKKTVELEDNELKELKYQFGFLGRYDGDMPLVLLGSSTWLADEILLLEVLEVAKQKEMNVKLLIIPRHAERKEELKGLLSKYDGIFKYHFRTDGLVAGGEVDIYVGDTTGEVEILSQAADIAFIGKSLDPNHGGQTPIECANLGIPMVTGPNMENFKQIVEGLSKANGIFKCKTKEECRAKILLLLESEQLCKVMRMNVLNWVELNRGATKRTAEVIRKVLFNLI